MLTMDKIKTIVPPICKRYGVKKASLFGSYARKEATEKSDIDIYIEPGEIKTLFKLSAFRIELVESLGISVDVVATKPDIEGFACNIERDGVVLYES